MRRAIISVSDKTGIVDFERKLTDLGIEIISTGGTAKTLSNEGINVLQVSEITGFAEDRVRELSKRKLLFVRLSRRFERFCSFGESAQRSYHDFLFVPKAFFLPIGIVVQLPNTTLGNSWETHSLRFISSTAADSPGVFSSSRPFRLSL